MADRSRSTRAGRPASDFGYGYGYGLTGVNVIDVADPTAPTSLGTSWFEGSAQAVRATDGVVRVVVTSGLGDRLPFVVPANGSLRGEERAEELNRELVEESVAEDWLPRRIDEAPGGTTSTPITTIGCDRIGQPEEFSGLGLTWIATVDLRADAPETLGSAGVVSTGGTTYASADHLYVSTVRWDPPVDGVRPMRPEPPTTAIHSFGIAGRGDAAYEASGVDRRQLAEPVLDVRARGAAPRRHHHVRLRLRRLERVTGPRARADPARRSSRSAPSAASA